MSSHDHTPNDYAACLTAAYARYNGSYDNETYLTVQKTLVRDVCGLYQAHEPALLERALNLPELNTVMQLVTDAALELCGHPDHQGEIQSLLQALVRQPVTEATLHAIVRHWENFEEDEAAVSQTFLAQGRAALMAHDLQPKLISLMQITNDLPGLDGNTAHLLAQSASRIIRAAELVLIGEPSRAYVEEQLRVAERALKDAQLLLAHRFSQR